ncbi:MAG: sulfatase [Phycisphaerae bacterium]
MSAPGNTRRDFLKALGVGTAGLVWDIKGVPMLDAAVPKPAKGPNLIFVFADQLRYQSVGYAGDRKAKTPNIDRLASEGVSFCNAVSSAPVCAPYRGSLFTGKYASSTGVVVNELRMNPNHECFGHVLTASGYQTGYIGKWHLWANQAGNHSDPRNHFIPPGPYRLGFDGCWAAFNFHHNYYNAHYHTDTPKKIFYGEGVYEPDAQTDMAIDFIRRIAGRERPFALFLSYGTPHDPWSRHNVPKEYYDMFKKAEFPLPASWSDTPDQYMDRHTDLKRWLEYWKPKLPEFQHVYYAMSANLDWNIGRLLRAIDDAGIRENTIFVFTSDHGEMFGAHGRVQKAIFYEEAVRVPFLLRWSGRVPAGHVSDACLGTPDIMPTLLSLMGLPVPKEVEGIDLSHPARGEAGEEPEAAFLQGMGHTYLWKDGFEWRALRDKRYTYAIYHVDKSELLFDNQADPHQVKNLAGDPKHQTTLERFRRMLKKKMDALNDAFEKCTWYRDHWTKNRNILRGAKGGTLDLDALDKIMKTYFPVAPQP